LELQKLISVGRKNDEELTASSFIFTQHVVRDVPSHRRPSMSIVSRPVELQDHELDAVSGGVVVAIFDVIDVRNNEIIKNVDVDVNAAAAVAVLGAAGAGAVQNNPTGRIG
jgi:hypothetical protein